MDVKRAPQCVCPVGVASVMDMKRAPQCVYAVGVVSVTDVLKRAPSVCVCSGCG